MISNKIMRYMQNKISQVKTSRRNRMDGIKNILHNLVLTNSNCTHTLLV